jgi:hypothetical protein
MTKISELFQARCVHRHTIKSHPHCFDDKGKPVVYKQPLPPKVLILDIETLPIVGYSWGVWNQNIYPNQIIKDWCILSFSAKWLGDDRIISDVLTSKEAVSRIDKRLCNGLWKLLNDADVVVAHNGNRFDIKKINARFWKNDLHKTSSYKVIDTLISARQAFGLTYNKLDFIAKFIGADEKLATEFELWSACDNGDKNSLLEMKTYNEQDILTLEEIYLNMREWIPNHPDLGAYQNLSNVCPVCLDNNFKEIGLYTAKSLRYPEFRCDNCDSVWHSTKKKEN